MESPKRPIAERPAPLYFHKMSNRTPVTGPGPDPIAALAETDQRGIGQDDSARDKTAQDGVLALITGTQGPSYRPVGATMAIFPADLRRIGSLSSGCVEADITLQAVEALAAGAPRTVLYGEGSPFMDIRLPCGGGLEILLLPRPDRAVLAEVAARRSARRPCTLVIDRSTGALSLAESGATGPQGDLFRLRLTPELRFLVFGKGPEASTFAALVQAAGFPSVLISPDAETLGSATTAGAALHITHPHLPAAVPVDRWSAIVLFFHDHDWEPPILKQALATEAFYIGSQGSQRARDTRLLELEAMGVSAGDRARLHGPIGLINSARDARTLAVSVLAEVLDTARALSQ